jgi:hypothetical protein
MLSPFLTLALDSIQFKVSSKLHTSSTVIAAHTHCVRGWVGPISELDVVKKKISLLYLSYPEYLHGVKRNSSNFC